MDLEKYQKRFKGIKILLVEDDQLNQQVETELLESVDFSVDTAGNGMEALDLFKGENQYNLILMDMQMPKMDGLTATRQIRRLTKGKGIPIIAMTGNAFPEDRLQCLNAGMNDVVLKPIDADNLFQILAQWIDASQISPESKTENAKDEGASFKNLLFSYEGIDFDQVSNVFDSDYKHFIEMIEKFDRLNAEKIDVCIEKIQSGYRRVSFSLRI
ncbi:response regulator [Oceanispirochaeta sp.]|jgi:two-component system sensor histidine kinase/response regulator|uniref:response regulator n=1 Tax=Oceanispirochaeta sp. TaxID=2035350 RepID=UPI00260AA566|nr:response regulator [Oceanispirochaeta sp.]MDA3958549.1 response regulator [Oceanispirochaeta sp.]